MPRKRYIVHGASLLVGFGALALYIAWAGAEGVAHAALMVPMPTLALAGLLFLGVWFLRVWTFHRVGRTIHVEMSWRMANQAFLGSSVLNLIFPARLGDVGLIMRLAQGHDVQGAAALVTNYRSLTLIALPSFAVVLLTYSRLEMDSSISGIATLLVAHLVLLAIVGSLVVAAYTIAKRPVGAVAARMARFTYLRTPIRWAGGFTAQFGKTMRPAVFLPVLLISGFAWFLELSVVVLFIMTLAPETSVHLAFGAPLLGQLVAMVRLTPGGLGLFEGTVIGVLVSQGTEATAAVAAAVVARASVTFLVLVVGSVSAYHLLRHATTAGLDLTRKRGTSQQATALISPTETTEPVE